MSKRQRAERQYTGVAMPEFGDSAAALAPYAKNVGNTLFSLAKKRDEMNMNNMLQDANTEMAQATAEWQRNNAEDPFNPQAAKELKMQYDKIFDNYGSKVAITSRGDWNGLKSKAVNNYLQSNLRWASGQAVKNAQASVNMGFKKAADFAYESGRSGTDIGLIKANYNIQADQTRKSLQGIGMSDTEISESLHNFRSDYMKSFIQGVMTHSPERAQELLKDKNVREDIGSKEATDLLEKMSDTQLKRMKNNLELTQIQTEKEIGMKLAEDPDAFSVADLQRMEMLKQIRGDFANDALAFKTGGVYGKVVKPQTYNDISDMISGRKRKDDGSVYDDTEINAEIMKNASDLTQEAATTLTKNVVKREEQQYKDSFSLEVEGLEATLMKTIGGKYTMESIKGTAKGKIDEILYNFKREVMEKDLNPTQIRDLATRYKQSAYQSIDANFELKQNEKLSAFSVVPVGQVYRNMNTGERMTLDKDGRWVALPSLNPEKSE